MSEAASVAAEELDCDEPERRIAGVLEIVDELLAGRDLEEVDVPDGEVVRIGRQERTMSDLDRVEIIAKLRRQGWPYTKIGEVVGLSPNGAKYALHKVTHPGRYIVDCEEEVDPPGRDPRA